MSIGLTWGLIPILIAVELGVVAWLRRDRYPRFLFHPWAATGYLVLVLADCLLAALVVVLLGSGSPDAAGQLAALLGCALAAGIGVAVAAGLTLFFRWITHTDIGDIPD